jgi:hypothetical protein
MPGTKRKWADDQSMVLKNTSAFKQEMICLLNQILLMLPTVLFDVLVDYAVLGMYFFH